ncbi:XapX domain-containing protein [Cytobacillus spongiae]|jgi:XapX domain-containing protein|uniref:XapX domain-containing protein n=1 Tax=Cytobacillus spongiae TaxID=2901381 RepID=UPI001F2715E4|nr:XapX domain-containing protein [Cytobacillus spongiae]UII54469.1 XapX domain-containing protein [Cytobacillus spongiae]
MKEIFLSLLAGIIIGLVFKGLKLPLPAPSVFAGIVGILGVYLGGVAFTYIAKLFS